MSKEPNHIDDIFKKSFEHASMPAPDKAFQAIQTKLAPQAATTTTAAASTLKIAAIASAAVISIGALVYVAFQKSNSKPPKIQTELAIVDTIVTPANVADGNLIGGSKPNGVAPHQIVGNRENENVGNPMDFTTAMNKGIEGQKTQVNPSNEPLESTASLLVSDDRSVNSEPIVPLVPLFKEVNAVSKASPEEKNEFKYGAVASKSCKGRFEVDLDGEVAGAHELAMGIQGQTAQYVWGCGYEVLGSSQGKEANWKGPIYVKKSKELNFWVRAHFMDGCRDTIMFSRWFAPFNGSEEEVFPSVFTPNGDGFNDSFYVVIPTPKEFDILVMDMRGSRVFSSQDPSEKWSGYFGKRKCEKGIYKVQLRRRYFGEADSDTRNFTVELR